MRIVYLIAIEDIIRSPLIRSQVIALLKVMAARQPGYRFTLVALYPLANWLRFRTELAPLRAELADAGIRLQVLPIVFLTRLFYIPRAWLPLYRIQAFLAALWIWLSLRPTLIHCRSYPAAWIGRWVKRLCAARLVFDARALYPEEGITRRESGKTRLLDEADFDIWKRIEAQLIAAADQVVAVSRPMAALLSAEYPTVTPRLAVAPTCTAVPTRAELNAWRAEARRQLGLQDQLTVAYVGGWFDRAATIGLFRALRAALPAAPWYFLLLVAVPNPAELADLVRRELGPDTACMALNVPQRQVIRQLAAADLAALPIWQVVEHEDDPRHDRVVRTILSVKFAEYLAAGLPVLTSQRAGAAADIVTEHDLGIVYDRASATELAAWLARWQANPADFGNRAWRYAAEHFDLNSVAERYLGMYREHLGS